jgi:hypothetical protein
VLTLLQQALHLSAAVPFSVCTHKTRFVCVVQVLLAGADPLLGIPDDMCWACPYQDCQVSSMQSCMQLHTYLYIVDVGAANLLAVQQQEQQLAGGLVRCPCRMLPAESATAYSAVFPCTVSVREPCIVSFLFTCHRLAQFAAVCCCVVGAGAHGA